MNVITRRTLRGFWERHPDAEQPLKAWHAEMLRCDWKTPHEIKARFGTASVLRNGRMVFNIHGNSYRLVVDIDYIRGAIFVKFIGTHAEYDRIDAETINVY